MYTIVEPTSLLELACECVSLNKVSTGRAWHGRSSHRRAESSGCLDGALWCGLGGAAVPCSNGDCAGAAVSQCT
jgi:hypothetical protein